MCKIKGNLILGLNVWEDYLYIGATQEVKASELFKTLFQYFQGFSIEKILFSSFYLSVRKSGGLR